MFSFSYRDRSGMFRVLLAVVVMVVVVGIGVRAYTLFQNTPALKGEPAAARVWRVMMAFSQNGEPWEPEDLYPPEDDNVIVDIESPNPQSTPSDSPNVTPSPGLIGKENYVGTKGPRVLIYHTHTLEAYTRQSNQDYVEVANWRTDNQLYNVVRVGEEIASQFNRNFGVPVIHDRTDYENPKLGTAYERSLKGVQLRAQANGGAEIYIDVHRDAWNSSNTPNTVMIDGKPCARIMFVVGKGENFTDKPDFESNLKFAQLACDYLASIDPQLCRGVSIKEGRYNQNLSSRSLLVEMGHNQNSLDEVLNSSPYVTAAIMDAYQKMQP